LSHKKASVILFQAGNPLKKSDRRRTIATAVDMIDNASTLNTLRRPFQQALLDGTLGHLRPRNSSRRRFARHDRAAQ
jgi:hypothetical protein